MKVAEGHGPHAEPVTAVVEVSGVQWATEKAVVESVLGRRPGVLGVDANPVSQTATVTYDPARTSVPELAAWIRDCGYHCRGLSVPEHVCDPLAGPTARPAEHGHPAEHGRPAEHGGHAHGGRPAGRTAHPGPRAGATADRRPGRRP